MILSRIRSAETNGMQLHEVRTKLDIKFLSFVHWMLFYRSMVHDRHESSILTATSMLAQHYGHRTICQVQSKAASWSSNQTRHKISFFCPESVLLSIYGTWPARIIHIDCYVHAWPTLWAQNVPAKCNRRQLHEVRTKLDIKFLSFVQRVFCYRFMDYRILAVSVVPKQGQLCRCIIKGKRQF